MKDSFFKYVILKDDSKNEYDLIIQRDYPYINEIEKDRSYTIINDYVRNIDQRFIQYLIFVYYTECHDFLKYHYEQYKGPKIDFLRYLESLIDHILRLGYGLYLDDSLIEEFLYVEGDLNRIFEVRANAILDWINSEEDILFPKSIGEKEQLVWKGTPSQLAYVLQELTEKDFLQIPTKSGIKNYKLFAEICLKFFKVKTTPGTFAKYLSPDDEAGLDPSTKTLFKIPARKDLPKYGK